MATDSVQKFGMKITNAQREYYRYTGVSADIERRGRGSNVHDFTRLPNASNSKPEKQMPQSESTAQ
jgi:hypothetical protein